MRAHCAGAAGTDKALPVPPAVTIIRPGENTARAPRVEPARPPENEPGESHAAPAASPPSGPLTFIARNRHGQVLQCIHWRQFKIHALFQKILYTFNKERFMFD